MRNAAYRRHHRERKLKHARFVVRVGWGWKDEDGTPEFERRVRIHADNLKVCSLPCCGNRRPHEGPRYSERRAMACDGVD